MNDRRTVASAHARLDVQEAKLDRILALLESRTPAQVTAPAPEAAPAPAPEAPKVTTKVLNRSSLRAFKATKRGKAYAGVSVSDILTGKAPMPAGFHAPTGERKAAIAAWKAAQEG